MKAVMFFFITFSFYCCTQQKTKVLSLHLPNYNKKEVTEDYLSVILIKSFSFEQTCNAIELYSNAYLCKETDSGDTLWVFEPCAEMYDFAKNDYKEDRDIIIEKKNITHFNSSTIKIKIDTNLKIDKK